MEEQRGLVRDHTLLVAPEPGDDKVLMVSGGEVAQAVDATLDAEEAASLDVLVEQGARVAGLGSLGRGEVAVLGWDFARLVMAHGRGVETGGMAALRQATAWLTGGHEVARDFV